MMMMMMRGILTPRHSHSFSPHAFLERTAPACRMQTAVTTVIWRGGDLLSVKSLLSQSASPPCFLQDLPFYELSFERNRTQTKLRFYYVHDFFFFCLAPISPLFNLASFELRAETDLTLINTMTSHRDCLLLVRWSRLLLPRTSEHHHRKKDRKATVPNFSFHGNESVTQGFLMPTREVKFTRKLLNKFDLIFHWGCCSVFLLLWCFLRHIQCIILNFFKCSLSCHWIIYSGVMQLYYEAVHLGKAQPHL